MNLGPTPPILPLSLEGGKPDSVGISQYFYFYLSIACILVISYNPLVSHDIWWHLQVGKDLWNAHIYPNYDRYSYTAAGTPWCIHSWLADVGFYVCYKFFGRAFFVVFPLLIHSLFASLVLWAAWRSGCGIIIAAIFGVISAFLVNNLEIRPHLFSELGFLLTYFCFFPLRNRLKHSPYLLALIFILWTNLHGMTLPAALLFAVAVLAQIVGARFLRIQTMSPQDRTLLLQCSLVTVIASIIHPTPLDLIRRNFAAVGYPTKDWQNLSHIYFQNRYYYTAFILYFVISILYLFLLIQFIRRNKGFGKESSVLNPGELVLNLLCLVLAFSVNRLMFFLSIPLLTAAKLAVFLYASRIQKIESQRSYYFAVILFITFLFCSTKFKHDQWCAHEPAGAMAYWKRNALVGNVFTHPLWSGYVTWHSSTTAKIFCDTRIEPFLKRNWIIRNVEIYRNIPENLPQLRDLETTHILVPRSYSELKYLMLSEELTLLYQNANELLFAVIYPYKPGEVL